MLAKLTPSEVAKQTRIFFACRIELWHYVKYAPNDAELAGTEGDARSAKRGIWADAAPVAPWEFRKPVTAGSPCGLSHVTGSSFASQGAVNREFAAVDERRRPRHGIVRKLSAI